MRTSGYIGLFIVIIGCQGTKVTQQSAAYYEDLSIHRLEIPESYVEEDEIVKDTLESVVLEGHIGDELDSINRIVSSTASTTYYDGYEIQVYNGNSRQIAVDQLAQLKRLYPEMNPYMSYFQPNYRVKAGRFFDRLEATKAFVEMKKYFPRALLIPGKLKLEDE